MGLIAATQMRPGWTFLGRALDAGKVIRACPGRACHDPVGNFGETGIKHHAGVLSILAGGCPGEGAIS